MSTANITQSELESMLDKKLNPLNTRISELSKIVEDVLRNVTFISAQYDSIVKRLDSMEQERNKLAIENKSLKAEVLKSSNEICELKDAINKLEQYSRRDCLEVRGIPQEAEEDTTKVIMKLGKEIGVNIHQNDISVSHRVPSRKTMTTRSATNSSPAIIVKFVRRDVRDQFYHARKELRNKTTTDLGYDDSKKIYISESLTQKNKDLLYHCRNFKKERGFKFVWTTNGRISLRKDDKSPAIHILSMNDLQKLQKSQR